jgi:hypothetical protein
MVGMSLHLHLPGPFSVRLPRLSLRDTVAQDRETIREAREGVRELREAFTRKGAPESKKSKKLRRETARENDRLARQYRRDGTIT